MLTKKSILSLFVVSGLVGAAAAVQQLGEPRSEAAKAPSGRGVDAASKPIVQGPGWVRGARYSYDLSLRLRIGFRGDSAKARNGAEDDDLELTGTLHTTVITSDARHALIAYALTGAGVREGSGAQRTQSALLTRDVGKPFYVELDANAAVSSLSFEPEVSPTAETILRNLVAALRVPRTPAPSASWSERELDANGECEVRYACQDALCTKQKLRYRRVTSGAGLVAAGARSPRLASSRFEYASDRHGRLLRMAGKEVSVVDVLDAPVNAELELSLNLKSVSLETGALVGIPAGWREVALTTTARAFGADGKGEVPDDVRGATTASLLTAYLELPAADIEARGRALARLSSLWEHNPGAIADAARLIREGGAGARVLAEALGGAQSSEGQSALARVIADDSLAHDVRAAALRSTILVERPNAALIESLRGQLDHRDDDVRRRTLVAFGAGAQHVLHQQPELARSMTVELLNRLRAARSTEERIAVVRALGNTGHEAALPMLVEAARDPDALVRAAAVRALRFQSHEDAAKLLRAALTGDPSDDVRRAALFAAEFQPASRLVGAVASLARTHADKALRGEAIRVLGKFSSGEAEALEALTEISTGDPDAELRELAGSLLNQALARVD